MKKNNWSGVYAAAITPLNPDFSPNLEMIPVYLEFLAERGCHGALLLGTTGEGPSFEAQERLSIFKAAKTIRQDYPDFRLLAGTGTPSLEETVFLTKSAFDLGFDGVVVLPPYYFHQANDTGIFEWFQELINRGIPRDGNLFGYHFPAQARVGFSEELLLQLRDSFPNQFVGIKDSSASSEYATHTSQIFDDDFVILTGNDRNMSAGLAAGASGCITALANLESPNLRAIWERQMTGQAASKEQSIVNAKRTVLEKYPPFGPTIKALVAEIHGFSRWPVRPPLTALDQNRAILAAEEMNSAGISSN